MIEAIGSLFSSHLLILLIVLVGCQRPPEGATETVRPAQTGSGETIATRTPRPTRTAVFVTPPATVGSSDAILTTPPGGELLDSSLDELKAIVEKIGENERFAFYRAQGAHAPPLAQLQRQAAEIYETVSQRLQTSGPEQIEVIFLPPDPSPCPVRGTAGVVPPDPGEGQPTFRILLYAGEKTRREQVYGVLAHELAHILNSWDARVASPRGLREGFASWAAQAHQTKWYGVPTYDVLVQNYLAEGRYLPLHQHEDFAEDGPSRSPETESCLKRRDILYGEWASFIGYLIDHYGFEQFLALIESTWQEQTENVAFSSPPDYEGVYGAPLEELEEMWLASLAQKEEG